MKRRDDNAVSPVVGVMLMLVVVIIIAAVVSAYAGSSVSGQKKTPQALITAKFSITQGMEITHTGGDVLATKDLNFIVRNGPSFGPNLEIITATPLNKTDILNSKGYALEYLDGSSNVTSFSSGDTLYIKPERTTCNIFQKNSPQPWTVNADGWTYSGTGKTNFWALCFRNPDSVGKSFRLEVADKASGKLISSTDVVITG
jgi:archaeal type IV pilus assembly protein PilA